MNQPGPYIMYTTVDANGYLKNGSGKSMWMATTCAPSSFGERQTAVKLICHSPDEIFLLYFSVTYINKFQELFRQKYQRLFLHFFITVMNQAHYPYFSAEITENER